MNETKTRRTEIMIETHSLTIIKMSQRTPTNFVYCRNCQMKTAFFGASAATLIFRVTTAEIERLLQTGQIHTNEGSALCGNSLAEYFKNEVRFVQD